MSSEFYLIRYVPNVVTGEFVNIGVILKAEPSDRGSGLLTARFTRDWQTVIALDPKADIELLKSLGDELEQKLAVQDDGTGEFGLGLLNFLRDSLSNSIQITDPNYCDVESTPKQLDQLCTTYLRQHTVPA